MAEWNHAMCAECWNAFNPDSPTPDLSGGLELCCFCGEEKAAGIYVRRSPADPQLVCGGNHEK